MPNTILVVDDNDMNLVLLSKILGLEGFQVVTAQNGTDALRAVEDKVPDLAILDVMMPDMDGYELCRRLRQSQIALKMPIVMLTAMSSEEERRLALDAGANDVWTKPFEMNVLRQRIGELLNNK